MLVTRGFLITVGNMIDKPPLFHAGVHCGTDLDGKISAVIFVHEIAKGNIHPAGFALILFAVIAIVDRDDVQLRSSPETAAGPCWYLSAHRR